MGKIAERRGSCLSNVSNRLACLKARCIAAGQRQGEYVPYSLSDKRVKLDAAAEPLADVVEGVYACTRYARRPEHG